MIQRWLVVFAREHIAEICAKLMRAANEHALPSLQLAVRLPHAGDEPEDPSEYRDDSSTFFLLETLRRVLCAAVENGGGGSGSANLPLRKVPESLLTFCFEQLSFDHPTAVRHVAAQCVGVLSRAHLKPTVELYLAKAGKLTSDKEQRECVGHAELSRSLHSAPRTAPATLRRPV